MAQPNSIETIGNTSNSCRFYSDHQLVPTNHSLQEMHYQPLQDEPWTKIKREFSSSSCQYEEQDEEFSSCRFKKRRRDCAFDTFNEDSKFTGFPTNPECALSPSQGYTYGWPYSLYREENNVDHYCGEYFESWHRNEYAENSAGFYYGYQHFRR